MKTTYRIESEGLVACPPENASIFLYCEPAEEEKRELAATTDLDAVDLEGVFDPDEVPRVEFSPDGVFIIWKRPDNTTTREAMQFEVSSLGIVMNGSRIIFIVPHGNIPMTGREFRHVTGVEECLLRVLLHTVHHYQSHLKAIKQISQELQSKLVASMENRYLLQMFALGESLIYYHNALEANYTVLARLRAAAEKLRFTSDVIDLLDDVMIENQQAGKQAGIYTTVLSGLMDARGTIINNNMNVLLKNLTIINVVFLPLNLIAGIGGMSEYSMFTRGIDWRITYGIFAVAMLVLGWLTWLWLVRVINRHQRRSGGS
ncbi:MAG: magnesium transporter CorA family protein [Phycisphaerae bacterium]|nr:magnesium transporter CorA family protein [Phycisphaerae bacterium]